MSSVPNCFLNPTPLLEEERRQIIDETPFLKEERQQRVGKTPLRERRTNTLALPKFSRRNKTRSSKKNNWKNWSRKKGPFTQVEIDLIQTVKNHEWENLPKTKNSVSY